MGGEKKEKDGKEPKEHKEPKDKKDKKDKKEKNAKLGKAAKSATILKVKKSFVKGKKVAAAPVAPKVLLKTEDDYEPVNRWWETEDGAMSGKRGAKKWDTFEHHGLMFAPDYEPHGVPIKYDGKEMKLTTEAEEIATYWCSVKGTDYEKKDKKDKKEKKEKKDKKDKKEKKD